MKAMILAAGFGTRLRPVTWTLPKPVVPVCNRPLIAWAVDNFLRAGIDDIIVNLHHLPEAIEHFLGDEYRDRCAFAFSRESEILGTGGAIRRVRPLLERESDFFLANGDTIQFPPLEALRKARRATDALAALTLRHPPAGDKFTAVYFEPQSRDHEAARPRGEGQRRNLGTSEPRDPELGAVTGFGSGTGEALMFSGCHCLSTRVLDELPDREFSSIVDDVYQPILASGRENLAAVVDDGLWFDIGKPQRYVSAAEGLLRAMVDRAVDVPAGSHVENGSIVSDSGRVQGRLTASTVGARSVIEGVLDRSFVWDDCRIGNGVRLTSCIVAHGVEIAQPMSIENAIICRDDPAIPRDPAYRIEDGLVIAPFNAG